MTLFNKLAEVEAKIAVLEDSLGLPQRKHLLIRHQVFNSNTRLVEITDTLIIPKPYITSLSPRFMNMEIGIEGTDSTINLSINDIEVEMPRTFPKNLLLPQGNVRTIFILEPPVNNNQVVYSNPLTKAINGASIYRMVVLIDSDPTLWKFVLRRENDIK